MSETRYCLAGESQESQHPGEYMEAFLTQTAGACAAEVQAETEEEEWERAIAEIERYLPP